MVLISWAVEGKEIHPSARVNIFGVSRQPSELEDTQFETKGSLSNCMAGAQLWCLGSG